MHSSGASLSLSGHSWYFSTSFSEVSRGYLRAVLFSTVISCWQQLVSSPTRPPWGKDSRSPLLVGGGVWTINCPYRVSHVRILIIWHLVHYFDLSHILRVVSIIYGRHSLVWLVAFWHRHNLGLVCGHDSHNDGWGVRSWAFDTDMFGQVCGLWSHSISPIGISSYFQRGPFTVPGDQNVVHTPSSHSPKSCLIFGSGFMTSLAGF